MSPVSELVPASPLRSYEDNFDAYSSCDCLANNVDSIPYTSRPASPIGKHANFRATLKEKLYSCIESRDKFFSLEFFPPRTRNGGANLLNRIEYMSAGCPLFVDITWNPSDNPSGESETSSMMIAHLALRYLGIETMLHMTCLGYGLETITEHINEAKRKGIRNILALRGDAVDSSANNPTNMNGFNFGYELVQYINTNYTDQFTICVAGYPTGHPEASSYEQDLLYLKAKVDSGSDFIITQLFFKASTFKRFVDDCRVVGINCPIIPGIMPIQSYDSLRHISLLSRLKVPQEIMDVIQPLKGDDAAIRNYGVHQAVVMIKELLKSGYAPGVHLYTLNREIACTEILKQVGLWESSPARRLPFKSGADPKRYQEDVRPIFWNKRSKVYVYRTRHWDEFPNGRWGNNSSPAFGQLKDYYLFYLASKGSKEERLAMWGYELKSEADIWDVFVKYLTGEPNSAGVTVTRTPFSDNELDLETEMIADKLAEINKKGVLTVNSQPSVNCLPSNDSKVGWGQPGGYVFQKAYLEFFTSKEKALALLQILGRYPSVNFQILNHDGSFNCTNSNDGQTAIAVTWGVFPGSEIIQPTIVDPISFDVWREEAYCLWYEQWAKLYEENSESRRILNSVSSTYFLINLVDNDFPQENCLWNVLDDMFARIKLNDKLCRNDLDMFQVANNLSYAKLIDRHCQNH